jgi:hypothetical protein
VKAAIVHHAHHALLVTALSGQREALVTVLNDQREALVTGHRVQRVHAPVDSLAVQDHADHHAMAIVHNVVLSTKARQGQGW